MANGSWRCARQRDIILFHKKKKFFSEICQTFYDFYQYFTNRFAIFTNFYKSKIKFLPILTNFCSFYYLTFFVKFLPFLFFKLIFFLFVIGPTSLQPNSQLRMNMAGSSQSSLSYQLYC